MRQAVTIALLLTTSASAQDSLPGPDGAADPPAATQPQESAPAAEAGGFKQQVSYSLGLDLGRRLRADGIDCDLGAMVAGIRDGLTAANPMLTDEQIKTVMTRFQQELAKKAEAKMADAATENLAKGEAFLNENRAKEGIQETDSGLQYRVVEQGDGPSPTASSTVKCHYEGTLIDGSVFDSSYKRGQPAEFPVGGVIAGWTEALQMMQVGAKWEVFLPAKIAYGQRGAPGAIGPNETLIFTIELLDIVD